MSAAIEVLADGGYASLTVAAVIQRAHVSRKTFYEMFANRDECFEAVFEHISARGLSAMSAAVSRQSGVLATVRAGLESLLALVDQEPALARIWFVESPAGPVSVLERRARAMSDLADVVDGGERIPGEARSISRLVAEANVGAVAHVIHTRLLRGGGEEPFATLAGPLTYLVALPYVGPARAGAELTRASPLSVATEKGSVERLSLDESMRGLKIRLTYRTIRAMTAVSEHPGASNLQISAACDIKDQGQMSKLLSRLNGLGLIENRGLGRDRGAPNAWHTTERGANLVEATKAPDTLGGPGRASVQAARVASSHGRQ